MNAMVVIPCPKTFSRIQNKIIMEDKQILDGLFYGVVGVSMIMIYPCMVMYLGSYTALEEPC
jgi:hypothetical protein